MAYCALTKLCRQLWKNSSLCITSAGVDSLFLYLQMAALLSSSMIYISLDGIVPILNLLYKFDSSIFFHAEFNLPSSLLQNDKPITIYKGVGNLRPMYMQKPLAFVRLGCSLLNKGKSHIYCSTHHWHMALGRLATRKCKPQAFSKQIPF